MSYKTITGKGGISATIVADSVSAVIGTRITTMELVYHRFIHSQVNTHRQFSRNAMSSRAVPVERMLDLVGTSPAVPIRFGKKQSGMVSEVECGNPIDVDALCGDPCYEYSLTPEQAWLKAKDEAVNIAKAFDKAGYAKETTNRLLESFQMIKVLVTATEWDNFFHLRLHSDAQPEIQELARVMKDAMEGSEPELLYMQEWHTPYVDHLRDKHGDLQYILPAEGNDYEVAGSILLTEQEALKVSASCSAQISYRRNDQSLEKAVAIYQKLVDSEPVHASAFEHAAMVMSEPIQSDKYLWEDGVTHMDKQGNLWSGNFKHWVQYRQLIPNNVYQPVK